MANQNLSQFTEKLFVADADHTFIWDTVGAISKRVSRNSWLNSGTLTSDAPVTISQTWNGTGSTVFTAFKVNAASTASDPTSKLLDLQLGGVSKVSADKIGGIKIGDGTANGGSAQKYLTFNTVWGEVVFGNWGGDLSLSGGGLVTFSVGSPAYFTTHIGLGGNKDTANVKLWKDADNTLALRNGANAQTFNVYGTYTSGTSYERLTLSAPSAANAIIGTNKGSGGGTARGLELQTDGVTRMTIDSVGAASFGTNSVSCQNVILPAGGLLVWAGTGRITNPSTGVFQLLDGAQSSFNRLQFGGTTDAFPAIARDGAGIKFTGAAAGSTAWIKVPPVAVGSLPVAATAGAGARAFVNDASAPVFGTAVAGGGAVLVPVYCTGSAWNVG